MKHESIEDMKNELELWENSLIIRRQEEKAMKHLVKEQIQIQKNHRKEIYSIIRERKVVERKIKSIKTKISQTPSRLRRWSKENTGKVINKILGE
jgi:hypothetical protein